MTSPALQLWARLGPIEPQWQLGPRPEGVAQSALVGWSATPAPVDGGVPAPVARVLSSAFAVAGRVSFLRSSPPFAQSTSWTSLGGDSIRDARPPGLAGRLASAAHGTPALYSLVCTRDSLTAAGLFEDAGFPWWLQSQVILLSGPDEGPPTVTSELARSCCGDGWAVHFDLLRAAGVVALARPGVDGDVLGLYELGAGALAATLSALAASTSEAGGDWRSEA